MSTNNSTQDDTQEFKPCKVEGCHFEAADDGKYCQEHQQQIDESEDIVEIVKDTMSQHEVAGAVGTSIVIKKGKCLHCGSNRLKVGHNEPAGVAFTACPVCDRDDMSTDEPFDYEIGAEATALGEMDKVDVTLLHDAMRFAVQNSESFIEMLKGDVNSDAKVERFQDGERDSGGHAAIGKIYRVLEKVKEGRVQ